MDLNELAAVIIDFLGEPQCCLVSIHLFDVPRFPSMTAMYFVPIPSTTARQFLPRAEFLLVLSALSLIHRAV